MLQFFSSLKSTASGFPTLIRSWDVPDSYVPGVAAHDDPRDIYYNLTWGARPYRRLASDRNTYPGRIVSKLYSASDLNGTWTDDGVVFDNGDNYCFPYGSLYDPDRNLYVSVYVGPDGGGGERIGIMESSDMITWSDKGYKIYPGTAPCPVDITRIFGGAMVKDNGYYYITTAEYPADPAENYWATKAIALYKTNDFTNYATWERIEILNPDPNIEFEEQRASETSLIWSEKDSLWILYYQGGNNNDLKREIGLAYSQQLEKRFIKLETNPIVSDPNSTNRLGTPNVSFIGTPRIFKDEIEQIYHLFIRSYTGTQWRDKKCT